MKLTELFNTTGEPFSYYPGLVHRFNISVNASVMLCFIAWKTFSDELDGWKSFNSDGIQKATGLSVKEQAGARRQLVEAGLLEEHYARLEHKLMFRLLPKELGGGSPTPEMGNPQTPKGQMGKPQKGESSISQELKQEGNKKLMAFPEIPPELDTHEFQAAWADWLKDRRDRRKPVTAGAAVRQLKQCAEWGAARAVQAINASIQNGWQGLFEPKEQRQPFQRPAFTPRPGPIMGNF